jgi:hypothetical protein
LHETFLGKIRDQREGNFIKEGGSGYFGEEPIAERKVLEMFVPGLLYVLPLSFEADQLFIELLPKKDFL